MTLSRIRDRELILDLPGGDWPEVDASAWSKALKCRPGCVAAAMAEPRQSVGSILLPDETGSRHRPDFGIIVGSCDARYPVGAKVGLRPYRGIHFQPFVCHAATLSPRTKASLKMRSDCVAVLPDRPYRRESGIEFSRAIAPQTGIVMAAGPQANAFIGRRIVFSRRRSDRNLLGIDPERLLHDRIGDWIILRAGQIVAEVVDSGPKADYVRFLTGPQALEEQICLIEDERGWRPAPGWAQLSDEHPDPNAILRLPSGNGRASTRSVVNIAGNSELVAGCRVVADPHPNKTLRFGLGSDQKCALMRENDIWMVID